MIRLKTEVKEEVIIDIDDFLSNWAKGSDEWLEDLDSEIEKQLDDIKEKIRDALIIDIEASDLEVV